MGYDGLGSLRQMTDWAGSLSYSANYDPYGALIEAQGLGASLGFTSEMTDETGLQYLRARYMDISTGTFLTRDPIMGQVGGASVRFNPYLYAGGNPVNYVDPDGRFFFLPFVAAIAVGAIAGALIGGGLDLLMQLNENGGRWDCIDQQRLGAAMLQGFVLGAVSGANGFFMAGLGVSGIYAAIAGAAVDAAAGYIYDRTINGMSDEEAASNALFGAAIGFGATYAGHTAGRWFGQNADEIGKKAAQNINTFWDELDYNSATSGGIPPNFFEKLGNGVRNAFDRFSYVGKLERQFMANGLPTDGVRVNRAINPAEMVRLTKKFNLEFELAFEIHSLDSGYVETNNFWLYSGTTDGWGNSVRVPESISESIYMGVMYHTHPNGSAIPSGSDIQALRARPWQYSGSGVIPVDNGPIRVVPYNRLTDYPK